MAERQIHGFDYQRKIIEIDSLLTENANYTDKWDATLSLPVSIKCIKLGASIDFGDFKRQTEIETDFILYVGFWNSKKDNIVEEYKILISKENWQKYIGNKSIISNMLLDMKGISNSKDDDIKWKEFRHKYGDLYGNSLLALRFKRDHKKQKRIQCGISSQNFKNIILKENNILYQRV